MLRTRLATALVALPLLYVAIVYAPLAVLAGVVVSASGTAAYEFFQMALAGRRAQRIVGVALAVLVAAGVGAERPEIWGLAIGTAVIVGLVFCLIDADDFTASVTRAGYLLLGVLYAGFLLAHFVLLRRVPGGPWWVLFTLFVAMASDSGGYFTGRFFGRHPLAERVSPKKTVEGSAGALVAGLLAATIAHVTFLPRLGLLEAWFLGAAISALSQVGDLTESTFKRAFGAKDSGWIIPGHGGVLDRIDSLVFPAVFSYYYVVLVSG